MKSILIPLILISAASSAFAETVAARELQQVQEQRQKAVVAAVDPITRRYQTSLEQLLRRATLANDLDTALKIKTELETLGAASPTSSATTTTTAPVTTPPETGSTNKAPLEVFLSGTRWEWFDSADLTGKASWIELYKDGKGRSSWGEPLIYQVTEPNKMKLVQATAGMNSWFFIIDTAKKVALPDFERGKGREIRSLRYQKKISSTAPR